MVENILETRLVGDLLKQVDESASYSFFIPAYQRGYRWDDIQVTDLLDDILEFIELNVKDQKYCLQPIVVKQLPNNDYEVIDGQQRLTTIFIILSRLKKSITDIELFKLKYETRPTSEQFLIQLDGLLNDDNPDYYYISNAYNVIDNWILNKKQNKPSIATTLYSAIAEKVEFIWYQITNDVDAIDIFTRLNIGKIPLTNSELVKAIFLSSNNLLINCQSDDTSEDFQAVLSLKKNRIAQEWDLIAKNLEDSKIWGFIYSGKHTYETRFDYILDIFSKKPFNNSDSYFSFHYFYKQINSYRFKKHYSKNQFSLNITYLEFEWNKIKENFYVLMEWYNRKQLNHLIGYLIGKGHDINELIELYKNNTKSDFINVVNKKIKEDLNCSNISELRYGEKKDNDKLLKILLLHNIVKHMQNKDDHALFPFHKMNHKKPSLEHIYAQNSEDLRENEYRDWLKDHLNIFQDYASYESDGLATSIVDGIKKLLNIKHIDKDIFQELFNNVSNYIETKIAHVNEQLTSFQYDTNEFAWLNDIHSIANLAYLDASINSSLKNSLFEIKREKILLKDKNGDFVPPETRKIFLKYYTKKPKHISYWTIEDKYYYVRDIQDTIKIYIS